MISCNIPRPMGCYQEEEKLQLTAENPKINYKKEMDNILQLIQHQDPVNRKLAIGFAKSVFNMDAYDLCQYLKKLHLLKNEVSLTGFYNVLELIELMVSGWLVHSASAPSRSSYSFLDGPQVITLTLHQHHAKMHLEIPEESRSFVMDIITKNYKLKQCAYRYALLKWDK